MLLRWRTSKLDLKECRVRCEKGEFLVVWLPNGKTKVIASCPDCSDEMPVKPLPGDIERLMEDGLKMIAYHGFNCNNCEKGPWWFTDGVEIDPNIIYIKPKEYVEKEPNKSDKSAEKSELKD